MCLDHLHKYQVERTGGISPSNLWKKLWIFFFFFSETNVKKDDLGRVRVTVYLKVSDAAIQNLMSRAQVCLKSVS